MHSTFHYNSAWYNETITAENNTVYVPVIRMVDEIDIPVKAPVCGGKVTTVEDDQTHEPNPYLQDVRPELTVWDDDPFTNRDNGLGTYDYWEVDPEKNYVKTERRCGRNGCVGAETETVSVIP